MTIRPSVSGIILLVDVPSLPKRDDLGRSPSRYLSSLRHSHLQGQKVGDTNEYTYLSRPRDMMILIPV
jgi:hypothetical protein